MQEHAEQKTNAVKAAFTAKGLYPHEKWEQLENGIYIAKSRMPRSARQLNILDVEMYHARFLVSRGSIVYSWRGFNTPPLWVVL